MKKSDTPITIKIIRPEGTIWNEAAAAEFEKIILDKRLSHAAFVLLMQIHAEIDNGNMNMNIDYFAELNGKNRSTIHRWMNQILKAGYAKRISHGVYDFEDLPVKFVR